MASDIFSIHGINAGVGTLLKNVIGSRLISMLGKTLAGNLLKLIPGVGSVVGGAINGSVAASITYSLGYALNQLAMKAVEAKLEFGSRKGGASFLRRNVQQVY